MDLQIPYSPDFLDEQERQLKILSQVMPGDRQGITPQFSPEQLQDEAMKRASSNMDTKAQAEADKLKSQQRAEELRRALSGQPPEPPRAPAMEEAPAAPSPAEIPQSDSIFDAISGKYKELQEQGRIGGDLGGSGSGKGGAANVSPKDSGGGENKDYLNSILSKLYGNDLSDSALKDAQSVKGDRELYATLGRGMQQIVGGLSRGTAKADTEGADILFKNAGSDVQNILQRREARTKELEAGMKASDLMNSEKMRDPSSNVSAAYRNMALQLSPKLSTMPGFEKMNATGIKELMPMIDMAIRMEAVKNQKEEANKTKDEKELDKRFDKVSKVLTSELAGSRTAFGKAATTYASAEKIQTMVAGRNPNDLDSREIAELARQLDTILSNGQPTISGMKKLIPESARGSLAKIEEYLTNERQGARMGSFLNQMLHTVDREKNLSNEQVQRAQAKLLAGQSDLAKKDPERWNLLLKAHGLPESVLDFDKKEQPKSDEVKVKLPDGRMGMIPRSNLKKAEAMGAVEVK